MRNMKTKQRLKASPITCICWKKWGWWRCKVIMYFRYVQSTFLTLQGKVVFLDLYGDVIDVEFFE